MSENLWCSNRLVYRGIEPEDDEFLQKLFSDPGAWLNRSTRVPVPHTRKAVTEYREQYMAKSLLAAMICLPRQKPIGWILLSGSDLLEAHHRRCDNLGIMINSSYRGRGYGTEAIKWALEWGFRRANLHRIGIAAASWNEAALKLYDRLGFTREGVKRDFVWHDGKFHDVIEMSMLESEWRESLK